MGEIAELINKYGFPIVMAVGMGWIIKYVWEWATKEVKPVISDANTVLIALIDRIRMLDNDLIRLNKRLILCYIYVVRPSNTNVLKLRKKLISPILTPKTINPQPVEKVNKKPLPGLFYFSCATNSPFQLSPRSCCFINSQRSIQIL